MAQALETEPVPLRVDAHGVLRIADTRVTLDVVVGAYKRGDTAEQIAQDYSTLDPADIYAVISYYLRHKDEVESYLEKRRLQSLAVRARFKDRFPPSGLLRRLQEAGIRR